MWIPFILQQASTITSLIQRLTYALHGSKLCEEAGADKIFHDFQLQECFREFQGHD
jgi:hypothetical protein